MLCLWARYALRCAMLLLRLSSVSLLCVASSANAQEVTGRQLLDLSLLELTNIVITAQKREEKIDDASLTVSAFSADDIFNGGLEDLGDLQAHVPNLSLHMGDAANAVIYLRGVGQVDSISFNDPGVGVYVDDVYMGRAQGSFLELMDASRVEVLRGPQGSLYGRNTIGGAVKFVSARPTDTLEGYAEAGYGNYNQLRSKLMVSGPLVEDLLRVKMSLAHSSRDGYADNKFDGQEDFEKDTNSWRLTALLTPTANLSFYATLDGSKNEPDHSRSPHAETAIYSLSVADYIAPTDDPFEVKVNYNNLESLETFGAALTAEYRFDDWTFKSISAYREMDYRTEIDLDATPDSSFGIYDFEDQHQFSQELQFIYSTEDLSLVSGLYYFEEDDLTFGGLVGPDFFVNLPGVGVLPFPIVNAGRRDQVNTSQATYAQLAYRLAEPWELTLGLRYTKEKKSVVSEGEDFFGTGVTSAQQMQALFDSGVGYNRIGYKAWDEWESFSPKFGINYRFNDEVLLYASATRGFKSGGVNGRLLTRPQPFDPETLWSYELGLKSASAERQLRFNMAAFYHDYKNFQLSRFSANPDTGTFESIFDNAGDASIWGLEMELTAQLTDRLQLDANVGYLKGGYDEFTGDFGRDVSSERELVNAPELSGRLGLNYDYELAAGVLSLSAAVSYRSKTYLTVSSSEVLAQGGYSLFEASVRFLSADQRWNLILVGQNLGDKVYREHGFDLSAAPGVQLGYYGAPRTYSLTARYSF